MSNQQVKIPLHLHPIGFIENFVALGADLDRLLSEARISQEALNNPKAFISPAQQEALIVSGVKQCNIDSLGLHVGLDFSWVYYGDLALIVESSPSLREAGAAFRRYTAIAQPAHQAFLAKINFYLEQANKIVVPIETPYNQSTHPAVRQFDVEFRTAIMLKLFDQCGYKQEKTPEMTLRLTRKQPCHQDLISALPVRNIEYGSKENAICANHLFFAYKWRQFRQQCYEKALAYCEHSYQKAGLCQSLEDSVRWYVDLSFHREINIEQVANAMQLSTRTLSRKLAAQNTNFREIVFQSRMNLAMQHIRYSKMSAEEIAGFIGFSSTSSLMRAVKNWSGLTICQIRNQT